MRADDLLKVLKDGLWHTTSMKRFWAIMEKKAILPEPDIPDRERYNTGNGKKNYPFVRSLGGISLFDFSDFDPEKYSENYPMSSWYNFVPYPRSRNLAVWIEINRQHASPNLISTTELMDRWNNEKAYGHNVMPHIEAGHIGPISIDAFKRAFSVSPDGIQELKLPPDGAN
ncbi:hypothetical protein SAMN05444141_11146 [Pseudovibrio denitrificans]|uniref:Uncharacterized protein n=1 Tax=Pseudovibrio denitrificans TaxID=258256 RepID=A0A1I7DV46_9HYPH|nr:hypothetical protein [Pseudovibrio denitrificans]SFU15542.1 hypothetical protein SAMN05444141_11146 [Pseudovibrio denitrificans]